MLREPDGDVIKMVTDVNIVDDGRPPRFVVSSDGRRSKILQMIRANANQLSALLKQTKKGFQ